MQLPPRIENNSIDLGVADTAASTPAPHHRGNNNRGSGANNDPVQSEITTPTQWRPVDLPNLPLRAATMTLPCPTLLLNTFRSSLLPLR
jgi:hypothetical protein